jgi:transcriptional regulator with XRE-family HTH domain
VTVAERFGRNLLICRRRMFLSQEVLAARAHLHRTEIGLLERAERVARLDTLMKLAGALEADPADLLRGIAWMPVENPAGYFHGSHWVP